MITEAQKKKMQEEGQLDDLVHKIKGEEASSICNQGNDAEINFCVDSGMTHCQIVEACGLKPLKCNQWLTDGINKGHIQEQQPKTTHEQLVDMLTELLNSVQTDGCDGCGTVDLETVNKGRRLLGWQEIEDSDDWVDEIE
jgi:hypothetical protein